MANSIQTAFPKNTTIAPADAATPTAEIAAATGKGAQLPKIASYAVATGDTLMGVSSMVGGITQAQYSMLMAELVRIQAKSAAYIEEVDALIKLLKKIIESLLNGMNPIAEFITDISTLQAKKYEDSSSAKGWNAI